MKKYSVVRKRIPEKIYKEIHRSLPIVCTDLVVTDGKRFFLVRRKNKPEAGRWWFPGGRIFKNELLKNAALRFLKRETGLKGSKPSLLGFYEYFATPGYFPRISSHTVIFVFKIKASSNLKFRLDRQSSAAKWFSRINPAWHPYIKTFLRKAGLE
ncbi:MAG: NUDIX domain-containing protein [Candidatus Liptonbacteria bacterium]|nr:NUDIX domain-containing protein [Candidatus Liptonbacteria bacterium]